MMEPDKQEIPKREEYGKLELELTGDSRRDKTVLNGKKLPVTGLFIHADTDSTSVELTCVQLPGGDPYKIEGYLISEEDYDWLKEYKYR